MPASRPARRPAASQASLAALALLVPVAGPSGLAAQPAPTPSPAAAASPASEAPAVVLPPIAVTATRGPRPVDDVPATITVTEELELERRNVTSPRDLLRYEPGVNFGNQPSRNGGTNFVIRGIGGNRVRVQVDGIRLPDFPESNAGSGNYTRDFVDLDTVRRVEILRGPASALYGSDALGGVVSYFLKDPSDYLEPGRNSFFSGRFGYNGADQSLSQTVTGAARAGNVEALLSYTHREGHEIRPNGNVLPNPQDYTANTVLGRFVYRLSDVERLRLTGELTQRDTDTNLRSELSSSVLTSLGEDTATRGRIALDYVREAPFLFADRVEARLGWTRLDRTEYTNQLRSGNTLRNSVFGFEQDVWSSDVQFGSNVQAFGLNHVLTYGVSLDRTESSRPRERWQTNLTTGAVTSTVAGETFPNKNFPDTTTWQAGAYLQDEITLGAVTLTPALRLDYYGLRAHPDADYLRASLGGAAPQLEDMDKFALSPKFGAVWRLDPVYSLYGQYAHGFRAPPYDSATLGFRNTVMRYEILPSTDLKPETSDGVEIGFRGRFANGSFFQLSGFYNRYENFIDTRTIGTSPAGLTQFQYRNLNSVTIYGAEARGEWQFAEGWALRGSASYAWGKDDDTGRPIDSVDPLRFVGGLAWQHESGFGAEAMVTHALRHNRVSDDSYFRAPRYTVLDLAMHYDFRNDISINAGLFNVTNEKYFNSQDVIGVAANSTTRDLYAQPGRYAAVNLVVRF